MSCRYSQITIKSNEPPKGGSCDVAQIVEQNDNNTTEGYALLSEYDIVCKDWEDPEKLGISSYNFYYITKTNDGEMVKSTLASVGQPKTTARLPYGDFTIGVMILDNMDASTDWQFKNISTKMPTGEMIQNSNTSATLKSFSEKGDSTGLAMFIKALNSVKENVTLNASNTEEVDNMINKITEENIQQLDSLKGSEPSSINEVNVLVDVLNSIVKNVMKEEVASYTIDLKTRQKTVDMLGSVSESVGRLKLSSPDQYKPYLKSTLDTMTAIMTGINTILRKGNKAPPGDIKNAETMDYDGDISQSSFKKIPDTLDEIFTQYSILSTTRQAKEHVEKMSNIIDVTSTYVLDKMVPGESTSTKGVSGAWILIAKFNEEEFLEGKTLRIAEADNSYVELPKNFCPSEIVDEFSNCKKVIGLTFVLWPVITRYYGGNILNVAENTSTVDIRIVQKPENQWKRVHMHNLASSVELAVPRKEDNTPNTVVVNSFDAMNDLIPLVYHLFNISTPRASYFIEINMTSSEEDLFLVLKHQKFPTPGDFDESYLIKNLPDKNGVRTMFMNSIKNRNREGKFVVGIGKLKQGKETKYTDFKLEDLDRMTNFSYKIKVFSTGCYLFNKSVDSWVSFKGLEATEQSNKSHTICSTNHMSEFVAGFIPLVNSINFDYVIANLSLINNLYLFISLCSVLVLYICLMLWAYFKDKEDIERRGAHPLPDNKLENKYIYELIFHTGTDSDATCESNISFILTGEYGETDLRRLPRHSSLLYRRYDRNTFVMTTKYPLGHIHNLRVFHDNAGRLPYDSWQLERIIVKDLQSFEHYNFETSCWLALNRGDGKIDRSFTCTHGNDDQVEMSAKFNAQGSKTVNQDNMWISIFMRPIGSRFTRKERVTVAASFLYLSMMLSAAFYQFQDDTKLDADSYLFILPIPSIYNAFFVIILAYPLNLVLSIIFKRSRPKEFKRCRTLEAIEEQWIDEHISKGMHEDDAEEISQVKTDVSKGTRPKVISNKKCLPWWLRPIGWLIAIIVVAGSCFMVFSYGITWGEIKSIKWFSSFIVSFIVSILITQWIKVLLYTCCSVVCLRPNMSVEDMDCDEEVPYLKQDEEWLHMKSIDPELLTKSRNIKGVDSQDEFVKKLSTKLTKDREMKFVWRGILMYCLFLAMVFTIVSERTDIHAYRMQDQFKKTFIKPGDITFDATKKVLSHQQL